MPDAGHRRGEARRTLGDIGHAIQTSPRPSGFRWCATSAATASAEIFHEPPNVLHYGKPGTGEMIREGMFFTIEPMINAGRFDVKMLKDGWTAVTKDRSLSAQFEHTVGVTADGCEMFTLSPKGYTSPPYPV